MQGQFDKNYFLCKLWVCNEHLTLNLTVEQIFLSQTGTLITLLQWLSNFITKVTHKFTNLNEEIFIESAPLPQTYLPPYLQVHLAAGHAVAFPIRQ